MCRKSYFNFIPSIVAKRQVISYIRSLCVTDKLTGRMTGRGTDRSPTADTWRIHLRVGVGVGVGEGKIEERFSGFVILCRCRRQRRPWQHCFFIHPQNRRRRRRRPSQPFHDHLISVGWSVADEKTNENRKKNQDRKNIWLSSWSVGRSAANLVLSSSSYCFCWLVGRRWKEKKDEKRLKKNRKICGRSFGRRSAVFGEGGRKAKR